VAVFDKNEEERIQTFSLYLHHLFQSSWHSGSRRSLACDLLCGWISGFCSRRVAVLCDGTSGAAR
ncbi:hypothetical protein, partial [Phaeovulum veldkampii]